MDRRASTRTSPHALPARGLHSPPSLGTTGPAEQEGHLRSPVPHQCRNPSRSSARSETPCCRDRLLQRLAHLEPATPHPSPCPLCCSCRWSLARSHPLGSLTRQLLPFQGSVTRSLSRQVRRRAQAGLSQQPAPLRGKPEASRTTQDLRCLVAATLSTRLDRVLKTSVRGPRICAAISRPLHPSRGHLQPSPGLHHRWPGHFSLARFRSPQSTETQNLISRQVLAPLLTAHPSAGFRTHPAFRFPRQPTACHDSASLLSVAGRDSRTARRTTHFFLRRLFPPLSLPQVWRPDEGHRATHRCRNPTPFSTTTHGCSMNKFSRIRIFLAPRYAPDYCASASSKSFLLHHQLRSPSPFSLSAPPSRAGRQLLPSTAQSPRNFAQLLPTIQFA